MNPKLDLLGAPGTVAEVEGNKEFNRGISSNIVAYDEDVVDEWGWIQAAIKDQIIPPSPMALKTEYYGWVVAVIKTTLECWEATSVDPNEADHESSLSFLGFDDATVLESISKKTGYVRVRIPELSVLPVPPLIPDDSALIAGDPEYCNRMGNELEKATLALTRMYPLFSYDPELPNQAALKIGTMVKVQLFEPKAPLRGNTPTSLMPHGQPMYLGSVIEGSLKEVLMRAAKDPLILPAVNRAVNAPSPRSGGSTCRDFDFSVLQQGRHSPGAVPPTIAPASRLVPPLLVGANAADVEYLARVMTQERGAPWHAGGTAPGLWNEPPVGDLPYDTMAKSNTSKEYLLGEWVGIAYVFINRANAAGLHLTNGDLIRNFGGKSAYLNKIQAADFWRTHGRAGHYARILNFARAILEGKYLNPIGARNHFLHPVNLTWLKKHTPLTFTSFDTLGTAGVPPGALPLTNGLRDGGDPWPGATSPTAAGKYLPKYAGTPHNMVSRLTGLGSYGLVTQVEWTSTALPLSTPAGHPGARIPGELHTGDLRLGLSDQVASAKSVSINTPAELAQARAAVYYVRLPKWSISHVNLPNIADPSLWHSTGTAESATWSAAGSTPPASTPGISPAPISLQLRPMNLGKARFSYAHRTTSP